MGRWRVCSDDVSIQFSGDVMLSFDKMLVPLLESGIKVERGREGRTDGRMEGREKKKGGGA